MNGELSGAAQCHREASKQVQPHGDSEHRGGGGGGGGGGVGPEVLQCDLSPGGLPAGLELTDVGNLCTVPRSGRSGSWDGAGVVLLPPLLVKACLSMREPFSIPHPDTGMDFPEASGSEKYSLQPISIVPIRSAARHWL